MRGPTKVAVLGGGPAGLSSAFHLSRQNLRADGSLMPIAERQLDITVYQLGWRVGGKGASSRNADHYGRIEEHGIHLFGGFYPNTWNMLVECYRELWPADWQARMAEQFLPCSSQVVTTRRDDGSWSRVVGLMPNTPEHPWTGVIDEAVLFDGDTLTTLMGKAIDMLADLFRQCGSIPDDDPSPNDAVADAHDRIARGERSEGIFDGLRRWLRSRSDDAARDVMHDSLELMWTCIKGAWADDLHDRGLDAIDDELYLDWLRRHGMDDDTLASPVVLGPANICFQYYGGDTTRPAMSAAAFLTFVFRNLLAPGGFAYFFKLGTAETVLLPLYDVLERRGVKIELFSRVVDVVPRGDRVVSVVIERQATPRAMPYESTIPITGAGPWIPGTPRLGARTWPATTPYDALVDGDDLRREGIDLESSFGRPLPVRVDRLVVDVDFDHAVLALPSPAHPYCCPSLVADRGTDARTGKTWAEMVDGLKSTPTQACQLWLAPSIDEMGLWAESKPPDERFAGSSWTDPLNGWVDYSDVIVEENWPAGGPRGLLYFCGPMLDRPIDIGDRGFPAAERSKARSEVERLVAGLGGLMPRASPSVADQLWPDPASGDRWRHQYIRANVEPNERYVLAAVGQLRYRRLAWHSGYSNLALAGDWIFTGFNISSFEGAMMSGKLASFALTGSPDLDDIVGYDFGRKDLVDHRPMPGEVPLLARG